MSRAVKKYFCLYDTSLKLLKYIVIKKIKVKVAPRHPSDHEKVKNDTEFVIRGCISKMEIFSQLTLQRCAN